MEKKGKDQFGRKYSLRELAVLIDYKMYDGSEAAYYFLLMPKV